MAVMRPVLFAAFGLEIASAPVFAGLAVWAAFLWFERRREELRLDDEQFWMLMAFLAVGVIAGCLGFYALAYGGGWEGNLAYWRRNGRVGGASFLGGLIGAVGAIALFCRRRLPFAPIADVLGAAAPLGLVVMRIGCLLNGCCHGRPAGGAWGISYTGRCAVPADLRGAPLHPTQLYEAAGALLIFLVIERIVRPRQAAGRLRPGDGLWISLGLYGALRFAIDFLRAGDPGVISPLGLSLAQWAGAAVASASGVHLWRTRS